MKRPQTIFRNASPKRGYTSISNHLLQHKGLPMDVRGFITGLLSRQEDWEFNEKWAREEFDCGETKILSVIRKSKSFGYMKVERERDDKRRYTGRTIYMFTDVAHTFHQEADSIYANGEKSAAGKTTVTDDPSVAGETHGWENPSPGETPPHTKELYSDSQNKEDSQTAAAASASPRPKRDLFEKKSEQPTPTLRQEVRWIYDLLQNAFKAHDRHYEPSGERDRLLHDLNADQGEAYIHRLADAIARANALKTLTKLKTNRLIEDDEIRARLLDGDYDQPAEPKPAAGERRGGRGVLIPDDWAPSEEMMETIVARYEVDQWGIGSKAAEFATYYRGKGSQAVDWNAMFMSWVERSFMRRGAPPKAGSRPRRKSRSEIVDELFVGV